MGIIARGRLVVEAAHSDLLTRYAVPAFEVEFDMIAAALAGAWLIFRRQEP